MNSILCNSDLWSLNCTGNTTTYVRTSGVLIEAQRLLGLDVSELKRIIVSAEKPAKSQNLFRPDSGLWNSLKPRTGGGRKRFMQRWMCGESDACQCCYCVPIRV
jgi:hypothetical protein